jgi:hypothetical protein
MRTITVTRNARVPFSLTIDLVEQFFRRPHQLAVGPGRLLRAAVVQEAAQIRDVTDDTMVHEALLVIWQARSHLPLPDFHGLLTVRVNCPTTEVSIRCSYKAPLGIPGRLFDATVGRYIAAATLRRLLDDICAYVERQYQVRRSQSPVAEALRTFSPATPHARPAVAD